MSHPVSWFVSLGAVLAVLAACSEEPLDASLTANPSAAQGASACDRKLLTVADVTGILSEPITGTAPLKGDAQTCYFVTATAQNDGGPEIMISLRQGVGRTTVKTWQDGHMDTPATRLEGVGDSAVWIAATKEIDAQKNDLLCVAGMGGSGLIGHSDDLPQKLAGLCKTIFARAGS